MAKHTGEGGDVLRWVRELQAGVAVDENSRRLFLSYHDRVLNFFKRRRFPAPQAADLAQDTFLRVFREIASFREDSTFEGWLFAIAANVFRNELRSRDTQKRSAEEVSLDAERGEPGEAVPGPPSDDVAADRAVFEDERRRALRRAVESLPPQMGRCLELRVYRDLEYREIASLMKLNVNTVKAHLFHARQRLKEILAQDFGEWDE